MQIRQRLVLLVSVLLAALLVPLAGPANAAAYDPGTLGGYVYDTSDYTGLSGVTVQLYNSSQTPVTTHMTASDGSYEFAGLADGTYYVGVPNPAGHVASWAYSSTTLAGADALAVDSFSGAYAEIYLDPTPTGIKGRITAPNDAPVDGASVTVYQQSGSSWYDYDYATTDSNGDYSVDLPSGTYRVGASASGYTETFYTNAETVGAGTDVSVTQGNQTTADVKLLAGASVSGTVTSGSALQGVTVEAWKYFPDSDYWDQVGTPATTNASGVYTLTGLSSGTYAVKFSKTGYVPEFWNDQRTLDTATTFTLTTGQAKTGVSAALVQSHKLSGTVTGSGGAGAVQNVSVTLYDAATGTSVDYASTDATGKYFFDVAPGTYKVDFYASGYLEEYWQDKDTLETATTVTVGSTDVTTISPTLNKPGKIHGTVSGPSGTVTGATVSLYRKGSAYPDDTTTSGAGGAYTFSNIDPGTYTVGFAGSGLAPEFHNNVYDLYDATFVTVAKDSDTAINATLAGALPVKGKVTSLAGAAIPGVQVSVERKMHRTDGTAYFSELTSTTTAADGTYTAGVSPGEYRVEFTKPGYRDEYFGETPVATRATRFTLVAGGSKTGVNDVLDRWGVATGTVTGTGGTPISGADVSAWVFQDYSNSWSFWASADTDAAGKYTFTNIRSDKVRLRFSAPGYTTEYYADAANLEAGKEVATPLNGTGTANAALVAPPRKLSGKVTTGGSTALDGADVTVERRVVLPDRTRWDYVDSATTDAGGLWNLSVAPGTYRVVYSAAGKVPEWWNGARSADNATPVTVTTADVPNLNENLDGAGAISGKVTDGLGNVGDAEVTLYRPRGPLHPNEWVETDYTGTDTDGTYSFPDLGGGPYRLGFDASGHKSEFYNNAATVGAAATVTVTDGATSTVNDVLAPFPKVSGTVRRPDNSPASSAFVSIYRRTTAGGTTSFDEVENLMADASGAWSYRVPAGSYVVCAFTYGLPFECRNDKAVPEAGIVTAVSTADVTGLDVTLNNPGKIHGTLSEDGTGKKLSEGYIEPYVSTPAGWVRLSRSAYTSDTGTYTLDLMLPGTYRLGFRAAGHADEFYLDKTTVATATDVPVTAGGDATANGSLAKRGTVSGRVLGTNGKPAEDASVYAVRKATDGTYSSYAGYGYTDADGKYLFDLPPGTYKLQYATSDNRVSEYYNNAATAAAAQTVTVGTAAVTLSDVLLGDGASISGTVGFPTAPEGWASTVVVRNASTGDLVGIDSVTTTSPVYRIDSLAAGSYRVEFARGVYGTNTELAEGQFWQAKSESAGVGSATPITLTATQQKTAVNATLVRGGTVTGSLRSSTVPGHALAGCVVTAYTSTGKFAERTGYSKEDGTFRVTGLTTGGYLLRVAGGECGAGSRYYDGDGTLGVTPGDAAAKAMTRGANVALGTVSVPAAPALQNTAAPTVTGTAKVGSTLTAKPGTWSQSGTTFAYQWLRGTTAITGATASTYKPTATDVGKQLRVRVTASKAGFSSSSAQSALTAAVAKGTLTCGTPTVSGTVKVGKTLTGAPSSCTPAATAAYAWLRDGVVITGKTAKTYTLVSADKGHQIQFRVKWTKAGYNTATRLSAKTVKVS
ncbi:carboxypeptidase regulatory-like domain-containing protein [Nocardioides marmoribigeumensis]|uniref:alpha-amylase n=1 Tax=Nocardioides marmoribigeumensis TaxID=433649 RepID=A0ABU2BPA7_9ACTN|nr:carboxypeptidase regulatory-like domain-containing protein [Nocardioides marmoribigeumensis]MDR7360462.1 protocatechuate 3,4-dioxygenase beta subunit [Nocardioides marmoribigeumensis]